MAAKTNEVKQDKAKQNGKEPKDAKRPQDNPLYFEIPVPENVTLNWLTAALEENRQIVDHVAVTFRKDGGRLMIGVLPVE